MKQDFYILQIEGEPSPIAIIKCKSKEHPDINKVSNAIENHFNPNNVDLSMQFNDSASLFQGNAIVKFNNDETNDLEFTLTQCELF